MRAFGIALMGVVAWPLVALPADACDESQPAKVRSYVPQDLGGETIRKVSRGDKLAIACDGVDLFSSDVRVVFNFAEAGARKLGYTSVLATEQTRADGHLQIRVPDAPDLANHTMDVRVFVMTGDTAKSCDAGKVRVV